MAGTPYTLQEEEELQALWAEAVAAGVETVWAGAAWIRAHARGRLARRTRAALRCKLSRMLEEGYISLTGEVKRKRLPDPAPAATYSGPRDDLPQDDVAEIEEIEPVIRPVHVQLPERQAKVLLDNAPHATLHYSDLQIPFHDPAALEILYQVCDILPISKVFLQGDAVDFWQLSDHRPPDERRLPVDQVELQSTFDTAAKHLAQISSLTPHATERVYMGGNHEDRWDRLFLEARKDPRLRYVLSLPKVQETLDLAYLLGLSQLGWQYHPFMSGSWGRRSELVLYDRLVLLHQDPATSAALWAARAAVVRYGKSVLFGHRHRIQNWTQRDLRGTDSGWCIGCLCLLDPHWTAMPDWAQGFAVCFWSDDRSYYHVEQIRIHEGVAQTPWGLLKA